MAQCRFCGDEFRTAKAVRAHLRHCEAYRAREPQAGAPQRALPLGSLPIGRNLPKAQQPKAGFTRARQVRPPVPRKGRSPRRPVWARDPELDAMETSDQWELEQERGPRRAEAEAEERRRREEATDALRQKRRQIIQRVKDQVIGRWVPFGYTMPPETKARALKDMEHELSGLAVEDLPESELVAIADGMRDKHDGPVMQAQDEAKRLEEQRRREEKRRADETRERELKKWQEDMEQARRQQEEERRKAEKRAQQEYERQQEEAERAADKRELVRYGKDFARHELQDVEDLDPMDRLGILQRVERELEVELTGDESEDDVEDLVDNMLEEEGIE